LLRDGDLPRDEIDLLGPSGAERIDRLVHDLVETSAEVGDIRQSDEIGAAMHRLREFMFERVYLADHAQSEHRRAHATIERIVAHLVERGDPPQEIVEYVAGMTDRFALAYAETL
jgi:dGTPase